jgi:hypothetical protein
VPQEFASQWTVWKARALKEHPLSKLIELDDA